jgi:hypothetical protein
MSVFLAFLPSGEKNSPRPWTIVDKYFLWSGHHWAWTGSIILSAGIAIWLGYEGWLVGWWPITTITAVQGGLILILALIPSVRKYYKQ